MHNSAGGDVMPSGHLPPVGCLGCLVCLSAVVGEGVEGEEAAGSRQHGNCQSAQTKPDVAHSPYQATHAG